MGESIVNAAGQSPRQLRVEENDARLGFRGTLPLMDSAYTDPELRDWPRWASESGNTPTIVRTAAEAALIACILDYVLLLLTSVLFPAYSACACKLLLALQRILTIPNGKT